MEYFFSCDWGTSSFRLRLIRVKDLEVLGEEKTSCGIADTYKLWQQQDRETRTGFYAAIIRDQITTLGQKLKIDASNIPVLLSGMASSTIGLIDLPYKKLPFHTDGSDLEIKSLNSYGGPNPLVMISGARTEDDVMRGEDTKIVGFAADLADTEQEQLVILPGTHPKHITLKNQQAVGFKTFMTGEFFDLLSTKSILSASVERGGDVNDPLNRENFVRGIEAGQDSDLLHASFMVRTNQVLKNISKQHNFYYLSGLLIGSELKGLTSSVPVCLLGGATHMSLYSLACEIRGINITGTMDADDALIKGQQIIFQRVHRA